MPIDWLHSFNVQSVLSWISGTGAGESTYILSRWLFLRALGVIYLIAFVSLWVQLKGLIGSNGILPAEQFLSAVKNYMPGVSRFHQFPTVFWVSASDFALHLVCGLGVFASILLIFGIAPMPSLLVLWLLYLSLVIVGQTFLSFQWDILLLEAGFLAIFFAPTGLLPGIARESAVSPLVLFLLWWLIFRLMFESGVVKLTSGDPTWRNLTALDYHYFTQPLPAWTSWYAHHLPTWFQKLSIIIMYVIELVLPFLFFFTRPFRIIGAAGTVFLNILIGATGNYNFFNLLTIALCIPLLDDAFWLSVLPSSFISWIGFGTDIHASLPFWYSSCISVLAVVILFISGIQLIRTVIPQSSFPKSVYSFINFFDPIRSVNAYGLFRVMTTTRPEIIIEGSNDGQTWLPYEFKYKPGNPLQRPRFIEPHQPRLDWQMWFAALGRFEQNQWLQNLMGRLLEGSPEVLGLLETNPFPNEPPQYIRAQLYDYTFSDMEERKEGVWWQRELVANYSPILHIHK